MKLNLSRAVLVFLSLFWMAGGVAAEAPSRPGQPHTVESKRPNILLLLADDMGYGELGCYGQETIRTPIIDALAEEGMLFTDFYAGNAVCAPSRAVLMTGKHAGHATVRGNSGYYGDHKWARVPLRHDEETLAEHMQKAGYETAFIGKWHLDDPNDLSTWAFARGFDFAVQPNWPSRFGGEAFNEDTHYFGNRESSRVYDAEESDCIDAFRTDIIIDYLDRRDTEKPLFLFMSYRTPHANEPYIRDQEAYAELDLPEVARRHAARITMQDKEVGRLLDKMEELGELQNTLVIFTSDNGPHSERGHKAKTFNSSGPFRGHKRDLYEGGLRVPLIAYWKGRIQPGSRSSHVGSLQDIMATFSEIAGAEGSDGKLHDGISFLPELLGFPQPQHPYLYWEIQLDGWFQTLPKNGFRQAVRAGQWKAVRYGIDSPAELYHLVNDPGEKTNLADTYPEITGRLTKLFRQARENTPYFPAGGVAQKQKASDLYSPAE